MFCSAAYYYPWHSDDFHRGQGYLREFLGQGPQLGEYDDRDPAVIRQHMEWSEQANISVWITSWFGPGSREDSTMLSSVMPTIEGSNQQFCLFYETANRIGTDFPSLHKVVDDINYMIDFFVFHPNYYHINGRPVLFIYITRVLDRLDILAETLLLIRSAGAKRNVHFYLVGDHAFGQPPATALMAFDFLDAVSNYDVYGLLGRFYVGPERLAEYYEQQTQWSNRAKLQNCAFMPAVTPGFNDRGVRLDKDHQPLARKLTENGEFGSLFRSSLIHAMEIVDPDSDNLLVVTSFNEWHEDTQIEPTVGALASPPYSGLQQNLTLGVEYEGYGTRYLDILREMTTPGTPAASTQPSQAVSASPSVKASTSPSQMLPETPSASPAVDMSPAVMPSDPNGGICDDSKELRFPTRNNGNQRCVWLAARPEEQEIYCRSNETAYHVCEETCGKCEDECEDTKYRFEHEGINRTCLWLSLRGHVQDEVCISGNAAHDTVCPETCDSCDFVR